MISTLTVGVLLFTAVSGILSVLAQLWAKDKPKISNGVRWISIGCIACALFVAVLKEYLVAIETGNEKTRNERLQAKLAGTIEAQTSELGYLRKELKDANVTISETKTKLLEAQLSSKKTAEGIQKYVYQTLYRDTHGFLGLLSQMIEDASDGWLPVNESEFFSRRSVNLICLELNSDGPARVSPPQPWSMWFPRRIREYKAVLADHMKAHGAQLDTALFTAMSNVEGSLTFSFILQWQSIRQQGTEPIVRGYPPVFCYGRGFVDLVSKDFAALANLYSEIVKGAKGFGIRIPAFPLPTRSAALGRNRFTPDQLTKWQKEHQIPAQ